MPALPGISRTQAVAGDVYRSRVVAWDRQGRIPAGNWTLTDSAGRQTSLPRLTPNSFSAWWDSQYLGEVFIPAAVKPGRYTLSAGPVTWPLEVVTLPKRLVRKPFSPGVKVETVQAALDARNNVWLKSGLYEWSKSLSLPPGATLTGPGAIIRYTGQPAASGHEGDITALAGGEWALIDGVTFDMPAESWLTTQRQAPNLTLVNCTFKRLCVQAPGPNLYVEDCTFDGSRVFLGGDPTTFCGGLLRRVLFTGRSTQPLTLWQADHNFATVDCEYRGTGRGPVCQVMWGDVRGNLFVGTKITGVDWAENAGESFSCEPSSDNPNGFHDNLILHYRLNGASGGGSAVHWDGRASGNLVREVKVDAGSGLTLWGGEITDNDFQDIELRNGASIRLRAGAQRNRFTDCAIIGYKPGAWNQNYVTPDFYNGVYAHPIWWDDAGPGPGNVFTNLTVRGDPQYPLTPGPSAITWTNCTRNGQPYQ